MKPDRARWAQVSPVLDALLALSPEARAAHLAQLRRDDAAWADELDAWLAENEALDEQAFMAGPAMPRPAGPASMAGRVIGPYTLERELGAGGMGSVWLGRRSDGRFEGLAAVKCLHAGLLARADVERFEREGRLLAKLQHPHIARLLDAGVTAEDTQPYLVLEYVDGEPIDQYCSRLQLDVPACLRLFLQVLAAVAHAHSRLILHRDLKPSNVLVTVAGEVKLLDFGIGRLLDEAGAAGADGELTQRAGRAYTLHYAAPEQIEGGEMSTATDVHALGVLLFLLLSGVHPMRDQTHRTGSTLEAMRAVVEGDPGRVSVAAARGPAWAVRRARALRGDLDLIVAKALKKAPAQRYANAAQMADDLNRHLDRQPIAARDDSLPYLLLRFIQRHRFGVAAGSAVTLALAVGIGLALQQGREAARQQARAESLIEFMLGDLPGRLRPVGRLDALDAVGERALAHYAAQAADRLDTDALGRRARALQLIGEIARQRGQLDRAAEVFSQAAQSTAELLSRQSDNAQRIFDHAQSEFWVGDVARQRGRQPQAETAFQNYRTLAQRLTQRDPSNIDWRIEAAYAGINLGVLYLESARLPQAMTAFDEAHRSLLDVVVLRPALQDELATTMGWIAVVRESLGDFSGALAALQEKAAALRDVPDAARSRLVQYELALVSHEMGRLRLCLGDAAAAQAQARTAQAQTALLVAHDDSNMEWLGLWAQATLARAEAELAQVGPGAASAEIDAVTAVLPRLLAADASRARWQWGVRGKWLLLRAQRATAGDARHNPDHDTAGLERDLDRYLADAAAREAGGQALHGEQQHLVAAAALARGDLQRARGRHDQARALWQAAAQRLQPSAAGGNLVAMTLRAQALWRTGAAQEARALAEAVAASAYRHPMVAALERDIASPSKRPDTAQASSGS